MIRTLCFAVAISLIGDPDLKAQAQYTNWFFGFGAGLDMGTDPPTPLTGSLSTDEGVASISDANGELLFYTNGQTVWQRDHMAMPNGWGLHGHFSASQSALIVPVPDDPDRYYIFTVPAEAGINGEPDALHWSMVDMDMNNGMGDVSIKNTELIGPVTEKLTATRHANGRDIWVVVHGWNSTQYYAYLVSCAGIDGPVVSDAGRPMTMDPNATGQGAIGCMQFDPQGARLAAVWSDMELDYTGHVRLDLLSFDKESGVLGDVLMDTHTGPQSGDLLFGYGVCFSPSGERLYMSEYGLVSGMGYNKVWQYDMTSNDPMGSELSVGTSSTAFGTMQRTPDGRIFIGRTNGATHLGSIGYPDMLGPACGLETNNISLGGINSTWGLPNNWDTFPDALTEDPIALRDTLLCNTDPSLLIEAHWSHPFITPDYLWSTGAVSPSIVVTEAGTYHVEIHLPCSTVYDTVRVEVGGIPIDLGPDLDLCEGQEVMLAAGVEEVSYVWNNGDTSAAIIVDRAGSYSVIAIDGMGCETSDEVAIAMRNCTCPLYLPNAFSPNKDGINDTFAPVHDCRVLSYRLSVFDRWGSEIFSADSPNEEWTGMIDGTGSPTALYAWKLAYSWDDDGAVRSMERTGHVTVLQ